MKKYLLIIMVSLCCLFSFGVYGNAQKPDYEKYGNIAISVVKADYPGEEVREYQYLGRKKASETTAEDSFRFEVKENTQTVVVVVKVIHNITNNKLVTVTVEPQKQ
nr:YqzG/YhdC family protein [Neobacillus sp. Marseille-Q6967]